MFLDGPAPVVVHERLVPLVDVGGQQAGRLRVGPRDDECRHAHHVGRQPGGVEIADVGGGRNENLAAKMAALLFRGELVFIVHACCTGLDEGLHDLECVERPAESCLGIGHDRREPRVDRQPFALRRLDRDRPRAGAVHGSA